jgi:hypothetical protein
MGRALSIARYCVPIWSSGTVLTSLRKIIAIRSESNSPAHPGKCELPAEPPRDAIDSVVMGSAGNSPSLKEFTIQCLVRSIRVVRAPRLSGRFLTDQFNRRCTEPTPRPRVTRRRIRDTKTPQSKCVRKPFRGPTLRARPAALCLPRPGTQWHRCREIQRRSSLRAPPKSSTRRTFNNRQNYKPFPTKNKPECVQ